eukprot:6174619-Pleurochrysis_carterae.AAC.1
MCAPTDRSRRFAGSETRVRPDVHGGAGLRRLHCVDARVLHRFRGDRSHLWVVEHGKRCPFNFAQLGKSKEPFGARCHALATEHLPMSNGQDLAVATPW